MPTTTLPPMLVGQTTKLHVQATGIDGTTPDNAVPLVISNLTPAVVSATIDSVDSRQVNLVGLSAGSALLFVDESPACPSGRSLQVSMAVNAPAPPNLRQVLFVSSDPPV